MKVICIEDVVMKEGEPFKAFTEGEEYSGRVSFEQGLDGDPYEYVKVWKVKNDQGDGHIIRKMIEGKDDLFYHRHFLEV